MLGPSCCLWSGKMGERPRYMVSRSVTGQVDSSHHCCFLSQAKFMREMWLNPHHVMVCLVLWECNRVQGKVHQWKNDLGVKSRKYGQCSYCVVVSNSQFSYKELCPSPSVINTSQKELKLLTATSINTWKDILCDYSSIVVCDRASIKC